MYKVLPTRNKPTISLDKIDSFHAGFWIRTSPSGLGHQALVELNIQGNVYYTWVECHSGIAPGRYFLNHEDAVASTWDHPGWSVYFFSDEDEAREFLKENL